MDLPGHTLELNYAPLSTIFSDAPHESLSSVRSRRSVARKAGKSTIVNDISEEGFQGVESQ